MVDIIRELIDIRSSLGYVKDFNYGYTTESASALKPRDIHYDIVLDMFRNDPMLSAAIDVTVESATHNGVKFTGENERLIKETNRLFFDKLDFDRILDNMLYQLLIYGDAFLEIRRDGNKITELYPLETSEMEIIYTKHGEITSYQQRPKGFSQSDIIEFDVENIVYFKLKWIGSRIYSYQPLEPIANSYTTKVYANNYLNQIFKHLPPKLAYILNEANPDQVKEFIANLRRIKQNPHEDLVIKTQTKDGFDLKEFQVKFDDGLNSVLNYLRQEVLMITRVPPMWIGLTEGGNRSTSEALIYPFEIRVRKLQSIVASQINKQLLPKMGLQNLTFKFNPIAFSSEKSIMEIAQMMRAIGLENSDEAGDHPVVYYLKEKGIQIPETTKIPTQEETLKRQQAIAGGVTPPQIQDDSASSRQRMNKGTDKMTSKLDEKGVSDAGKKKLEETKIHS